MVTVLLAHRMELKRYFGMFPYVGKRFGDRTGYRLYSHINVRGSGRYIDGQKVDEC